jgi:hypothetical protein
MDARLKGTTHDMLQRLAILVAAALSTLGCRCQRPPPPPATKAGPSRAVQPLAERFSREQGFAFVLPQLEPVAEAGLSASDCGACHEAIAKEWKETTHAHALRDLQYQAELHKPGTPRWLCLNCHIPLQNQRQEIVRGLEGGDVTRPATHRNPGFDLELQREAITCAACHVRRGAKGESVVVGARGDLDAPHPVTRDPAALRDGCLRCHDPRGAPITPTLICWFETRQEVAAGPDARKGCVGCHMPVTRRRLASGFEDRPERESHAHHWVGGGVPKTFAGYAGLRARGYAPALEVAALEVSTTDPRQIGFRLDYANARAGHRLPTADPERHLSFLAWLEDAAGRRLTAPARARIGQTWRWSPAATKLADNRLAPRERRRWQATLARPAAAARLVLAVLHVRLTKENARHMKATPVEETYLPGLRALVSKLEEHYPMATFVYREEVELATGARRRSSPDELVRLSAAEQRRPLAARDY